MEKDIYKVLGQRIHDHRKARGLTQPLLAERIGEKASASYISQVENAKKKISLEYVQKIATALKIRVSDLFSEKPLVYNPKIWEKKIASIVRDRPASHQELAYEVVKKTLGVVSKKKK